MAQTAPHSMSRMTNESQARETSPSSALCTDCGLCCMGALHPAANLDIDELSEAEAMGLIVHHRDPPAFELPCPKLADRVCTIYDSRPRACVRYRCRVLQQLDSHEIDLPRASDYVRTANRLLQDLRKIMPVGITLPQVRHWARTQQGFPTHLDQKLGVAESNSLRLLAIALHVYLDRYFKTDRDSQAFELSAISLNCEFLRDE